jgi:general secretion pathway protein H
MTGPVSRDSPLHLPRPFTGEKEAGFSLIELLAVLAVLALAIGLIAPAISRQMPGLELRAEARKVAHILESAQARAIAKRRPVDVVFDLRGPSVILDGAPALALDTNTSITVTAALGGVLMNGEPSFIFFPDGTTTGGRVALSRRGHRILIDANWLTGNVRTSSESRPL